MDYEYGVIGAGPAGYTVAMNLAKAGKSVIMFEKDKLGGTCLNKGCIPTKSFLHSSDLYYQINKAGETGIGVSDVQLDFLKVVEKKNSTVERLRKSLELAVKNSGVVTVYADACVEDKNTIAADGKKYSVKHIIVATGSKPKVIKGLEFDGKFILSSDDVLNLEKLPKDILIIGSGAIGTEWARIFSNFGVDVTMVEMAEHLVPQADIEVSKRVERIFKQRKIKFYLNDCVENITEKTVTLRSGVVLNPELVLVAVGREKVLSDCMCDRVLGDACGEIQLAHYAIQQAKEYALGIPFDKGLIPSVIYGEPEIAWVGLREQDMDESYKKLMLPVSALGKAWCDDSTEGFIKIIVKDNYIYGAHIVSKEASSLIHILVTAIQNRISVSDLQKVCFAHPTYSEGIGDLLFSV